jgi:hypothetical protein
MNKNYPQTPSDVELLLWINRRVQLHIGAVDKLEKLGNGAAYLILMSQLYPYAVSTEDIISHPRNRLENRHNLMVLSNCFQIMKLSFSI